MAFGWKTLPLPPFPLPPSYFKFSFSKACYQKYSDRSVVVLTSKSFAIESERSLYRLQLLPGMATFFLSLFSPLLLADILKRKKKKEKECMDLLLYGAVRWVVTEIKVLSLLNRCGMESANSLLSKPCTEGLYFLDKTLHSQAWREPELEKILLNRKNGHRSCVSRSGLDRWSDRVYK